MHCKLQEFKGYIFKIMGGQDKQGFPMKQGVLVPGRVRLLMAPGDTCFRGYGRRRGERRRKSVRGCIVSQDLSVLNLVIVKKGEPCLMSPELCELSTSGPQRAANGSCRSCQRELQLASCREQCITQSQTWPLTRMC